MKCSQNYTEKKNIRFFLGDYNVNISPIAGTNSAIEEINKINMPTRENKQSKTIIDNVYCNISYSLNTCDPGILRPYINDNHSLFSIMNTVCNTTSITVVPKRILHKKNISQFNKVIKKQTWDIVYNQDTIQQAFKGFQCVVDMHFNNCFPKHTINKTYRNRNPWITDHLRTVIKENNVISLKVYNNPDDQRLADDYKRKGNHLISALRNKEMYSGQLDLHANDLSKCWKILKQ